MFTRFAQFRTFRAANVLDDAVAWDLWTMSTTDNNGLPESVRVGYFTPNALRFYGVRMFMGAPFTKESLDYSGQPALLEEELKASGSRDQAFHRGLTPPPTICDPTTNPEFPPSPYKEGEKRKNLKKKNVKVVSADRLRCQGRMVFAFIGAKWRPLISRSAPGQGAQLKSCRHIVKKLSKRTKVDKLTM